MTRERERVSSTSMTSTSSSWYTGSLRLELIGLARRVRVPARERTVTKRSQVGKSYELT
jgi:hypothetical protein